MSVSWLSKVVQEIVVYRSRSVNIWENLAFEDWVLKNVDLSFRRILFLWRSSPCVVIGRHQNPWLEANIPLLRRRGVELTRRRSGGGAVYHDHGNLNCTMFTHIDDYNRPRNLRMVCDALNEQWPSLQLTVNERDDILCRGQWKVSGSAARLVKHSAYHHFTLLLSADSTVLQELLTPYPQLQLSHSSATKSRRSKVTNLQLAAPDLTLEGVCSAIAEKFYSVHRITDRRKVVEIDPSSESQFPGITDMMADFKNWEWNYGKTRKFSVTAENTFTFGHVLLRLVIAHGVIDSCDIKLSSTNQRLLRAVSQLEGVLGGLRFWSSDVSMVTWPYANSEELTELCNWIVHLM